MRSTFGSFNIATSGLFASQSALNVTSHNIANANTKGYSKQRSLQRATTPITINSRGVLGTGVETYDVKRLRSEYLDYKYWGQNESLGEWEIKEDSLSEIEGIFNEPSDTGIRKVMDEFFTSLETLSEKAGDLTARSAIIEKATMLVTSINRNGNEIIKAIKDTNFAIKSKVDEINSIAMQLSGLNRQIFNLELDGHMANDLRDQRSVLIDKLSGIINIDVNEQEGEFGAKFLEIRVGGVQLVDHINYNKLETEDTTVEPFSSMTGDELCKIMWSGVTNQEVDIQSGELKGLLDIRDGNGENHTYRGLPYYLDKLNSYAKDFTREFNTLHKNGYDLTHTSGRDFFWEDASETVNCLNFKVDPDIVSHNEYIAAASSSESDISDNTNILSLIDIRQSQEIFKNTSGDYIKSTPDDFVKSFLSALSVDSSQAARMVKSQSAMTTQTDIRRMSESGVSVDEEMAESVKLQNAYNASARMITTIDEILDTTINRLGLVGR